ncbi:hypothetical protein AXF42_Ash013277 [Apostasia shenzhenica]|uniref:Uncharacterized protein n=1 Tax=Apostasia shenzhenica TaxID=1088818 RepID=A0A2I0BBI5_9ASPA|nr:hypothetical protein AXF42_Ash013277 [Apostasia shenzhenica]
MLPFCLLRSTVTLTVTLSPLSLSSCFLRRHALRLRGTPTSCSARLCSSNSGNTSAAAPLPIQSLVERDWSFLELDTVNSDEERRQKALRIIAAAAVRECSRLLVCMGSEWFVDRLVESAPACVLLLVIHESLFLLAMIKEKYDQVRCWQGEIAAIPCDFSALDVVFVCYFPGMGVTTDQLLSSVAGRCSPGARLVISFDQGRQVIEGKHHLQHPDMVKSVLPERTNLEKAAAAYSFQLVEYVDEPAFYLAVLSFSGSTNSA